MNKHNVFLTSFMVWFKELFTSIVFLVVAFSLLLVSILLLGTETLEYYDTHIKLIIVGFGYIGIWIGCHRIFKTLSVKEAYFPRKTKYLIAFYQALLFLAFGYICYEHKWSVFYFTGMYASIFVQFGFNTIYCKINNIHFPKEEKNEIETTNEKKEKKIKKTKEKKKKRNPKRFK